MLVDVVDYDGWIVLYFVVSEGYVVVVNLLLEFKVDLNLIDWNGDIVCLLFYYLKV